MTGRENVKLYGLVLGLTPREIDSKFEEIVEFAELRDFIDAPVKVYSSGMYMRLAFSVAVSVDPDILLLDEVLAVGDEAFAAKCYARIQEFKKQGRTIVLVTHSTAKLCVTFAKVRCGSTKDRFDCTALAIKLPKPTIRQCRLRRSRQDNAARIPAGNSDSGSTEPGGKVAAANRFYRAKQFLEDSRAMVRAQRSFWRATVIPCRRFQQLTSPRQWTSRTHTRAG